MTMRVYRDPDADLGYLEGQQIAVIGFGNQGRAQALNLCHISGQRGRKSSPRSIRMC
ncbi:hypothetical protein ACFLUM_02365 [Chloroflexota bacterium]